MQPTDVAGPGAIAEQGEAPRPLLEGATEYEVVTLFNPLPVDFWGQVGQSKPVNTPFQIRKDGITQTVSHTEEAVRMNYGLNLKNPDHQARWPIVNKILIPSGKTKKLMGNEAQVVARQLVNEIMQRNGNKLMLADPFARHQVELEIVRDRNTVEAALGEVPESVQSQLRKGVEELNRQSDEQEFPGLAEAAESAKQSNRGSKPKVTQS